MGRYRVAHRYASWRDGERLGPWAAGETLELAEDLAEAVNRDSPGCLEPECQALEPEPTPEPEPVRAKAPERTRPQRARRTR